MNTIRDLRKKLNTQAARATDLNAMRSDYAIIPGRVPINGAGEAIVDVDFSVRFVDQPYFTFGFEMQEGEKQFTGQLPTGSAYVEPWKTIERLPFSVYYVGASIKVVTYGKFYQKMILNYQFAGTALTNPSL